MEPQYSYTKGDSPAYIFNPATGHVIPRDRVLPAHVSHTGISPHGASSTLTPLRAPGIVNASYSSGGAIPSASTNHRLQGIQPGLLFHRQDRRNSQLQITRQILELGQEANKQIAVEPQRQSGNSPLQQPRNADRNTTTRSVAIVGPNNALENRQQSPNEVDEFIRERSDSFAPMYSPGPSVEQPPDCAPYSWKVVVACAVLNACNTVSILSMEMCVSPMTKNGVKSAEKIAQALSNVRLITAPVTLLLIIHAGYRHICMVAGIMVGLGFFISGFLSTSMPSLIGFLVAGVAGMGLSFWYLSVIVALLEYFTDGRLLALILSHVGTLVASVIMQAIIVSAGDDVVWETAFKWQLVPAVLGFGVSLIINPLPQTSNDRGRKSFLVSCADALDPELFSNRLLYSILVLLFLDQLAKPIPSTYIPKMMVNMSYTETDLEIQPFMTPAGVFIGLLCLLFCGHHDTDGVLILFGALNIIIGYLTLQLPDLTRFVWIAFYSVLLGVNEVIILLALHSSIPELFGRLNIRVVACLFVFAAGIGRTASIPAAEELNDDVGGRMVNKFYLSGALILTSGVLSLVLQLLRTIKKRNSSSKPTQNRIESPVTTPEVTRRRKTGDDSRRITRNPYQSNEGREDSDVVEIDIEDITNNNPPGHM